MLTAIIDYGSGNLHSAEKAFQRMAGEVNAGQVVVTSDPDVIAGADRIVLPGDGAFPACRAELFDHKGIFQAMEDAVVRRAHPFLGICVGMQLMASWGREYVDTPGLGWIKGDVVEIKPSDPKLKVPHMGWNNLVFDGDHPVLSGLVEGCHAYFVHSYHYRVEDPADLLAHVDYGGKLTAIITRENMIGMQFHPEKSQMTGLRMIANFLSWAP
ncbi:imidazole glycerol phosphate synthase subunit HisH [Pseudohalocynthiibacter aestuariivivens]|jgi:imidazole glycerol-phosphate synthase subunit HisH|uniref:Imidazole glycerol phosphate synthase subunit HisH n=1 Tax=Pseudohalocynthiibacter aestuariivivens TaxID=1591409 RepID=A0ABV5JF97_9RHOB|nr:MULTISPECIES: imidazole glycerol phosphate synthase subunit HisH [Pseudohalocynthiibacter]MBS9717831.1 imidazole glycerol phosphate synthase subunit HisH [Pseudohalocynthiibacter aestuariivivens]MCK0103019.1 imidazole glycerol phosphate synthase subunit HisH [Pseudohalocynthiibacter sp. F2068]